MAIPIKSRNRVKACQESLKKAVSAVSIKNSLTTAWSWPWWKSHTFLDITLFWMITLHNSMSVIFLPKAHLKEIGQFEGKKFIPNDINLTSSKRVVCIHFHIKQIFYSNSSETISKINLTCKVRFYKNLKNRLRHKSREVWLVQIVIFFCYIEVVSSPILEGWQRSSNF